MADVHIYVDETGTLDFGPPRSPTESPYFGFGSAVFLGDHPEALWGAHSLRASLTGGGVKIPTQFHAKDDSWATRGAVFDLIAAQRPRFDATFLLKENAYPKIVAAGKARLYKMALYLHLKHLCKNVFDKDDRVFVVVATIGTKALKSAAAEAVEDVAAQMPQNVVACYWDSCTSWGMQVADYLLWAVQRKQSGKNFSAYETTVEPLVESTFYPWGTAA